MLAVIGLSLVFLTILLLIGKSWSIARSPRKQWERVRARRIRRDPNGYHADEPDEGALERYRTGGVIALLVLVPVAYGLCSYGVKSIVGAESARSAAVATLSALRSEHPVESPSVKHVRHTVHGYNPFAHVRDFGSDRYEISNALGRGTVCLTISFTGPLPPGAGPDAGTAARLGPGLDGGITGGRC